MRTITAVLAILTVLGPLGARAQDSSTNRYGVGNSLNCNTHTSQGSGGALVGFAHGFNDSIDRQGGFAAIRERHRERREEREQKQRYATAGKLIDAGKCSEARSFAPTSGDLDLAQRVTALCPQSPTQ